MNGSNITNITFNILLGNAFIGIREKKIQRKEPNTITTEELQRYTDNIYDLLNDKVSIENFHHGSRKLTEKYPNIYTIKTLDNGNTEYHLSDNITTGELVSLFQVGQPLEITMALQNDKTLNAFE